MQDIDLALRAADWPTERRNTEIRATYRVKEVTAIHSGLEQQEGLEYGLEAHHIWTETAIGTSAGGSHLVGEQRPLGTFSLPISAVFRRRFATDVQVAACHEIERPAEPVCASVVHIVALGQSLFAPLFGPPMAFRDSAQNSYQHGV